MLDLECVDYISSAGLLALDAVLGRVHVSRAQLVLSGLTEPVRVAFELAGLLEHFSWSTREPRLRYSQKHSKTLGPCRPWPRPRPTRTAHGPVCAFPSPFAHGRLLGYSRASRDGVSALDCIDLTGSVGDIARRGHCHPAPAHGRESDDHCARYCCFVVLGAATHSGHVGSLGHGRWRASWRLNYFFLPPVGTFTIADPQNWVALMAFLVVAGIGSQLSSVAQSRARDAVERRQEVSRLFDLSRDILLTTDIDSALPSLARHIARRFELDAVAIAIPGDPGVGCASGRQS